MINLLQNNYINYSKFSLKPHYNLSFAQKYKPKEKPKAESFDNAKINASLDSLGAINQARVKSETSDLKTKQYLKEVEYFKKISAENSKKSDIDSLMLKIYRQIGFKTPEDYKKVIDEIKIELINQGIDAREDEILLLFYKMTKYSNFDVFLKLSDLLKENGFDYIVNLNPLLCYLQGKGIFDLDGDKKAVFLDDFFFNNTNKKKARLIDDSPCAKFVLPTGWNNGATIFDLQEFDEKFVKDFVEIFKKAKKIKQNFSKPPKNSTISFDSALDFALNEKTFLKARKLGINRRNILVINSKTPENLTLEKIIANNLTPKHITKEQFEKSIKTISKKFFKDSNSQFNAQKLLLKYYNDNLRVYSGAVFNKKLHELHDEILKIAHDDKNVIYVTPTPEDYRGIPKSDKYITKLYLKINNIKDAKIVSHNEWVEERRNFKKGKVYVMLDDYSGSGSTLAYLFPPSDLNGAKIIYAPVFICKQAQSYVERSLIKNRADDIYLIAGDYENGKGFYDYISQLPIAEQNILKKIFYTRRAILNSEDIKDMDEIIKEEIEGNYLSYHNSFACVCLPHMAPDNNAYINANMIIPYFAPCEDFIKNYTLNSFYENCRKNS